MPPINPDDKRRRMITEAAKAKFSGAQDQLARLTGRPARSIGNIGPDVSPVEIADAVTSIDVGVHSVDDGSQSVFDDDRTRLDIPEPQEVEKSSAEAFSDTEAAASSTATQEQLYSQSSEPVSSSTEVSSASPSQAELQTFSQDVMPETDGPLTSGTFDSPQEVQSVKPEDIPSLNSLVDKESMDSAIVAMAPDPTTPEADAIVATLSKPIQTPVPELVTPESRGNQDTGKGRQAVGNRDTRQPTQAQRDNSRQSSSDTRFTPEAMDVDGYGSARFDGQAGVAERAGAAVAGGSDLVAVMVALLDRLVASNASAHQRITELVDRVDASSELDEFDEG